MAESLQHKLSRVRPPRVQITYDVEIGDAIQMKELPLVVGILADLTGDTKLPTKIKERKFVEIDRDNFHGVLAGLKPTLRVKVPNKLSPENAGKNISFPLSFAHLDDFHPTNIVNQVPELKALLDARQQLMDLVAKLDINDKMQDATLTLLGLPEKIDAESMTQLKELKAEDLATELRVLLAPPPDDAVEPAA